MRTNLLLLKTNIAFDRGLGFGVNDLLLQFERSFGGQFLCFSASNFCIAFLSFALSEQVR